MKAIVGLSSFVTFIFFVALQTSVTSCTKDVTEFDTVTVIKTDTVTVTKTDTVLITDSTVTPQLLTANSWKTDQIIGVNGNFLLVYERGATGNTQNYDNEYITFQADGSGVFNDASGYLHAIKWYYLDSSYTKLTYDVYNPYPVATQTVVWDNLRYKNGLMKYDQYWTYGSTNSHSQAIRSPK